MRSTAPLSTGMQIAIPLSGASAADTGRLALPESPCCRGRHDFPDEPLSGFGEINHLRHIGEVVAREGNHLRLEAPNEAKEVGVSLDLKIDQPHLVPSPARRACDDLKA